MGVARRPVAGLAVGALIALAVGAWWWQKPSPSAPAAPKATGPAAVGGGAAASATGGPGAAAAGRGGPPAVEVARVQIAPIVEEAQAVGTLMARQRVAVRPEVAGRVVALGFTDGAAVRKGQLLVQLDDTLQRAELAQAQAQLAV
ncbi:MAG: biotin/lipoyl-binding protein, partial [Treponemataceae bacterium]|nr:biotin/lipoyl-binding protein [Treponemataceae bacterium]